MENRVKNHTDVLIFYTGFVPERHKSPDGRREFEIRAALSRERSNMENEHEKIYG